MAAGTVLKSRDILIEGEFVGLKVYLTGKLSCLNTTISTDNGVWERYGS